MPKVLLSSPVRGLQGKFLLSDICYFVGKNGQTYARSAGEVANPRTTPQQTVRAYFAAAAKAWQTLTPVQREAWLDYARAYYTTDDRGNPVQPSGLATFVKANSIRQVLGLSIVSNAPTVAPPAPLSAIEQVGAMNPDELGITITHSLSSLTGLQVLVRMTPQMPTTSRTPRANELRYCRGVNAASATALTASGTDLIFSPTIFAIDDGARYGVEARIVRTADGIMSLPATGDFIKAV